MIDCESIYFIYPKKMTDNLFFSVSVSKGMFANLRYNLTGSGDDPSKARLEMAAAISVSHILNKTSLISRA